MVLTVGDDVWGALFRIQCAFPNMERRACLNEKDDVEGVLFTFLDEKLK